ncbi:CDP-glycerol glycerophosphotransferase family protein [Lacticaseibacillus hulanensis]|uniref:CDP-glycerol glycerophosphotransferase family protein n=1 Tax=Lacticaseibacillus hulanensis TaxID=2493111 RepID=UPI000FD8BA9D|nr:CDP-glycerol glycerophosphotransferase family protein [Lacticaseibacillus hulanensis]
MKIKSIVLTIWLSLFYPFTYLLKLNKKRVAFVSLEHDKLANDFELIYQQLEKQSDIDLRTSLFKFTPNLIGNVKYAFACVHQLFLIQSSAVVLLDYNNYVVSRFPHRKGVRIVELWHATGALKKFGNEVARDYRIKNYDYVIANSAFFKQPYAAAFNIDKNRVVVTGIPLNDKLFDDQYKSETRMNVLQKYPQLVGKTVVTYAPTFRGRIGTKIIEAPGNVDKIASLLTDDYVVAYKPHPLVSNVIDTKNSRVLRIDDITINDLFCATDILVTDYSAITIDWMAFNKPVIAFTPDLDKYANTRGLLINYEQEFPGPITKTEIELAETIMSTDVNSNSDKRAKFKAMVYEYDDGESTARVVDFIKKMIA